MIELKAIPVNGLVSNKNKTISPNKHYAAYTTSNSRVLHIINLKDKDNLRISEKDFSYSFFSIFHKPIKIYQISFNNNSDRLYCLIQKSQYTKLCQFKKFQNSNQPISKHWHKNKTTHLPFDVTSFTINEETQDLNLVGFTNKQVTYKVLNMQTQELINKNVEPVYSNITKIKLDPDNMKLSVLSENKELNIFTETNNGWKVKNTLYDCNDIPVSSQDGNILVDKKSDTLEIRALLAPHYGKVVYQAKYSFPIVDFSINIAGDKIKVFSQQYKHNGNINYSTLSTAGNPLSWIKTDYRSSLKITNIINGDGPIDYKDKICSLFLYDRKLLILFNTFDYFFFDYHPVGRNIKIITPRRQQNSNRSSQNTNTTTSTTNRNFNRSSSRPSRSDNSSSLAFTSFTASAAVSSSSGYSCGGYGSGCDGGGC